MAFSERKGSASTDFIKDYIYLFLIDVLRLFTEKEDLAKYEAREPGYIKATLKAYCVAFNTGLNKGKIDHEFYLSIYRAVSSHLKDSNPGYKKVCTSMTLNYYKNEGEEVAETFGGFFELIDRWVVKEKRPINLIDFHINHDESVVMLFSQDGVPYLLEGTKNKKTEKYEYKKHGDKLKKLLKNKRATCFLNSGHDDLVAKNGYASVEVATAEKMQNVFDTYNKEILRVKTPREARNVIATLAQEVMQTHPTLDCNSRTAYILLNRLLHRCGQPLTILDDPRAIGIQSRDFLVELIEQGQKIFLSLVAGVAPTFQSRLLSSPDFVAPYPITNSNEAVDEFFRTVIQRNIFARSLNPSIKQLVKNRIAFDLYEWSYPPRSVETPCVKLDADLDVMKLLVNSKIGGLG